jgi:TetR/AcrR family transcriptional repressor of nem operon
MPRVSADEKERSHSRIVQEASLLLRAQGLDNTSVSDVMKAAGLTHGGFYRHFKSKGDLVTTALSFAVKDTMSGLDASFTIAEGEAALRTYINLYLSMNHVRNPDTGCPLAALSVDAGRDDGAVRQVADQERQYVLGLLSRAMGQETEQVHDKAHALMALLVGAVTLARVALSNEDAEAVLLAARNSAAQLILQRNTQ